MASAHESHTDTIYDGCTLQYVASQSTSYQATNTAFTRQNTADLLRYGQRKNYQSILGYKKTSDP